MAYEPREKKARCMFPSLVAGILVHFPGLRPCWASSEQMGGGTICPQLTFPVFSGVAVLVFPEGGSQGHPPHHLLRSNGLRQPRTAPASSCGGRAPALGLSVFRMHPSAPATPRTVGLNSVQSRNPFLPPPHPPGLQHLRAPSWERTIFSQI